ncbi:transposase [Escherichia coli]|nr:transposase [Escherichia coli]
MDTSCALKKDFPGNTIPPEFKMELVRLALEEEGSIAALARKHDVNDNLLFKWIRLWQREGRVCRPPKKLIVASCPDTRAASGGLFSPNLRTTILLSSRYLPHKMSGRRNNTDSSLC